MTITLLLQKYLQYFNPVIFMYFRKFMVLIQVRLILKSHKFISKVTKKLVVSSNTLHFSSGGDFFRFDNLLNWNIHNVYTVGTL